MGAFVEMRNGDPVLLIDGEVYSPMAMTTYIERPEYLRELGEAGMRLFLVMANTDWLQPGDKEAGVLSGFEQFRKHAELLLSCVPEARIIVRIGMHPPTEWMEAHPDEIMRYSDGQTIPTPIFSEVHYQEAPGAYSMSSELWREDGAKALLDFCKAADALPYGDRIVGYFLAAGGTSEWYYMTGLIDAERVADYSPAFRKQFERFLREKYGTEEALREAWNMPDATFENPPIPTLEERAVVYADSKLLNTQPSNWQEPSVQEGDAPANKGVFLNTDSYRHVADFHQAWHAGTADSVIHFAKAIKTYDPGKLVGAFYGSYGCTNFYDASTGGGTLRILDSGMVDFLASPGVYNNREPGGYVAGRQVNDSFRIRGHLFMSEEDSRTHLEPISYRDAMQFYDIEDSIETLKRDFARNLCEGTYAWWFDQTKGGGRYEHEEIYRLFAKQQKIADEAWKTTGTYKNSEIALIYDQESIHCVSHNTSERMLDYYRSSDLGRIGAPVDYYFHNDMSNPAMPDYKLYLMLNTFQLTDSERDAIRAKAAKNGATVVWLYAPGYINPDKKPSLTPENISDMVGMNVKRIEATGSSRFRLIKEEHPALTYGDRFRIYGYIDRPIKNNLDYAYSHLLTPYLNPVFYIDDPQAETLGRYCIDKRTALAMKKQPGGWTSVYCATQILRSELIASLAEHAGCHLYNTQDDCVYANSRYVCIHAAYTGMHTLRFPAPCDPYEVYEERSYGQQVDHIEMHMNCGETKMFLIKK